MKKLLELSENVIAPVPISFVKANGWPTTNKTGEAVMVAKEKCAFLRGGMCLMHHAECSCDPLFGRCREGVRRTKSGSPLDSWHWDEDYNPHTAKGRFKFATRSARCGEVYSQCGKKVRYRTEGRAREVARKREHSGGVELRVYPCRFCGGWHLTSKHGNNGGDVAA